MAIPKPLTTLAKEGNNLELGISLETVFQKLKDVSGTIPLLMFLDSKLPYVVVSNAFGMIIGSINAILME